MLGSSHGLINYKDTKSKMSFLLVFNRAYRLEIQSVMLVFSTQLCELFIAPLTFSLVHLPQPNPPSQSKRTYSLYRQCVAGRGWRVLSCVGDHIVQKFNTLFLTIFKTYKIATPPKTILRRGGALRQTPAAKSLYRSFF